jgi:methionyl-tRNA formyltransferase
MAEKPRLVLFGSYYRGYYLAAELLTGMLACRVELVGIVTDDPEQPFVSPTRRLWQYPHRAAERDMVARLGARHGIPCHPGPLTDAAFRHRYLNDWRPDLCLMGTFGQRIDAELRAQPRLGFYNFHPSHGDAWPSVYAGGNPFARLLADRVAACTVVMHAVDDGFDTGALHARSEPIMIPPGVDVPDLHKLTSPLIARFARDEVLRLLSGDQRGIRRDAVSA